MALNLMTLNLYNRDASYVHGANDVPLIGSTIGDLFDRVNADGTTLVIVTHNPALAARARRRLSMRSGRLAVAGS